MDAPSPKKNPKQKKVDVEPIKRWTKNFPWIKIKQQTTFSEEVVSRTEMQISGKRWQKSRRDDSVLSELMLNKKKNQRINKKDIRRNNQINTVENVRNRE